MERSDGGKGGGHGFAGLSDLISDEPVPASAPNTGTRLAERPSSDRQRDRARPDSPQLKAEQPPHSASPRKHRGGSQAVPPAPQATALPWGWIGLAATVVLVLLVKLAGPPATPTTTYAAVAPSAPSNAGTTVQDTRPPLTSDWMEARPPPGRDRALSRNELRYCQAEKVRLKSMKGGVNQYSDFDVDAFNLGVNDYNSRCGEFRYREGMLESVQREIEQARPRLEQEGRSRLQRASSRSMLVSAIPDALVSDVQRGLNELGYDAGQADGLAGAKTRVAIEAFQRDNGIQPDGVTSVGLLKLLNATTLREPSAAAPRSVDEQMVRSEPVGLNVSQLSPDERQSLESACGYDRRVNGPASHNLCVSRQLAALRAVPRTYDLSELTSVELESMESACTYDRRVNGPASYRLCVSRQLAALREVPRTHDLSELTSVELESLESACAYDRRVNGPASYKLCVSRQLAALRGVPRTHDLSEMTSVELESMESACAYDRRMKGPAAYNQCISRQLEKVKSPDK